jgi:hypothetical protein
VGQHGVEVDDGVAELLQLGHLLVEERDRHRHAVTRHVVDLVVHEDAQTAAVAVDGADAVRGLADRAIDGVLQELLDPLAHAFRLREDGTDEPLDLRRIPLWRDAPLLAGSARRGAELLRE